MRSRAPAHGTVKRDPFPRPGVRDDGTEIRSRVPAHASAGPDLRYAGPGAGAPLPELPFPRRRSFCPGSRSAPRGPGRRTAVPGPLLAHRDRGPRDPLPGRVNAPRERTPAPRTRAPEPRNRTPEPGPGLRNGGTAPGTADPGAFREARRRISSPHGSDAKRTGTRTRGSCAGPRSRTPERGPVHRSAGSHPGPDAGVHGPRERGSGRAILCRDLGSLHRNEEKLSIYGGPRLSLIPWHGLLRHPGAVPRLARPPRGSLAAVAPEVATQWHPTRNGALEPTQITPGSPRSVWWKCPEGPERGVTCCWRRTRRAAPGGGAQAREPGDERATRLARRDGG
jgi:hypothetical protein